MAIVFDAASSQEDNTLSHTVTANGADRIVIGAISAASANSTDATYGGQTMTLLKDLAGGADSHLTVWYLLAPPTGANDFVVGTPGTRDILGMVSYTGVHQTNPFETDQTTSTDDGSDHLKTVQAAANQLVLDFAADGEGSVAPNLEAEFGVQTERVDFVRTTGCSGVQCNSLGMGEAPGAGSVQVGWTGSTSGDADYLVVVMRPSGTSRQRLTRYLHNTHRSDYEGRMKVLDVLGREVPPDQIDVDEWMRIDGPFLPSTLRHSSLVEDPAAAYIEGIRLQGQDRAVIETSKETLLESLLRRLGRGA